MDTDRLLESEFIGRTQWTWLTTKTIARELVHILNGIIAFNCCWLIFSEETVGFFEIHIVFNVVGYNFIMSEAMLLLSSDNSAVKHLGTYAVRVIHGVLGTLSAGLIIFGTGAIINSKGGHFKSIHAKLGLAAMVFLLCTIVIGLMAFFSKNLRIKPVYLKSLHNILSCISFLLGISSLCYGYQKKWFISRTSHDYAIFFAILTSISAIISCLVPTLTLLKQTKKIVWG